jgi:hypothetical protein
VRLEANIDKYGGRGRATYLADYLEYRACTQREGERISVLADLVKDRDWGHRDLTLIEASDDWSEPDDETPGVLRKFEDEHEEVSSRVGGILAYRARHLGDRYPFDIVGTGLGAIVRARRPFEATHQPYLGLLSITLAHAHRLEVPKLEAATLEDAFEVLVADAFKQYGLETVVIPTYEESYITKVPRVVKGIGLSPIMSRATFAKRAKDAGVDIVCHVPTSDPRRLPCFLLLGQATCGQTESWEGKATQPNLAAWRKILHMDYDPHPFLAIPHHVDPVHWPLLVQNSRAAIVDRIRIVSMAKNTTPDGHRARAAVLDEVMDMAG